MGEMWGLRAQEFRKTHGRNGNCRRTATFWGSWKGGVQTTCPYGAGSIIPNKFRKTLTAKPAHTAAIHSYRMHITGYLPGDMGWPSGHGEGINP